MVLFHSNISANYVQETNKT